MPRLDYFAILGVPPEASDEEIKKAYRKLALQYHPDRNQGNSHAEAKIREINAAYEVLGDPESKKSYELLRFGGFEKSPFGAGAETEEAIDPAVVYQEMERKLQNEARREMLSALMKDRERVKKELNIIRERVVASQGYDTFQREVVIQRASEVTDEVLPSDLDLRKERLLDVALQMLLSQAIVNSTDEQEVRALQVKLEKAYNGGLADGYYQACELFYSRR